MEKGKNTQQKKLPARYKVGIVATCGVLAVAIVLGLGFGLGWFGEAAEDSAAAGGAASNSAATVATDQGDEEETALEKEFRIRHSQGRMEDEAIAPWLDKWGVKYTLNDRGEIIVRADRTVGTIFYIHDQTRANSSRRIGLSEHPISDAPEFVFTGLSRSDVQKILIAERIGDRVKINFSKEKIKDLVAQDVKTMVSNVVVGIGHAEQIGGLYFGRSKTVRELSAAVDYLLDETDKAFKPDKDGYRLGMNRWVEKKNTHWYVSQDYLACIIPVINQIVDGAEKSVEVVYADYNWGLRRGDSAQLRRLELSTKADPLSAIVYEHRFKNGEIMERLATNIRDRRPEIPSEPKVRKAKKSGPPEPTATAKPGYKPDVGTKDKDDPTVGETQKKPKVTPAPITPTATIVPTATPVWTYTPYTTATPIGTKQPDAIPTRRPNDDPGSGSPEATPTVQKSSSEDVQNSQYQPQASPQGGGTSTSRSSIENNPTATAAPGGQIVTDPRGDGQRIENDQASTDPIETRPSDTGNREGNGDGNGAFALP